MTGGMDPPEWVVLDEFLLDLGNLCPSERLVRGVHWCVILASRKAGRRLEGAVKVGRRGVSRLADLPRLRTELTLTDRLLASLSASEAVRERGSLLDCLGTGARVSGSRGWMRPNLTAV
jgi:hypothetical protein